MWMLLHKSPSANGAGQVVCWRSAPGPAIEKGRSAGLLQTLRPIEEAVMGSRKANLDEDYGLTSRKKRGWPSTTTSAVLATLDTSCQSGLLSEVVLSRR